MAKDNSTYREKVALRKRMLRDVPQPVVCETHGGAGELYRAVYSHVERGIVFEIDQRKADTLVHQRPRWAVYNSPCEDGIAAGAGACLPINVLDCDPYGDPWPVLRAWFQSERSHQPRLWVVVNDGLRLKIKRGESWIVGSLKVAVQEFGNDLHRQYLGVSRWLLEREAAHRGYVVRRFEGYYCGYNEQMTHYAAFLELE